MRRLLYPALAMLAAALLLGAADPAAEPHGQPAAAHGEAAAHGQAQQHGDSKGHDAHAGLEGWKWANFLVLAAGLGYLIGKNAGPFFASRSAQIRKDMEEAEEKRRQAETRAAEVEAKLARLEGEIAALRAEAEAQQAAAEQRIEAEVAAAVARAEEQTAQEIEAAGKAARNELKRYSADLALELAERRIRDGMTPQVEDELVRGFVEDLRRPAS